MNQKKISLFKYRTGTLRNTKNQIASAYDFALKINKNGKYDSIHKIYYAPTGNCQMYSLVNFNNTINSITQALRSNAFFAESYAYIGDNSINKNDLDLIIKSTIDYISWTKKITNKNLMLLDLTSADYEKFKQIFIRMNVISVSPYRSTRNSDMVIVLIDVRGLVVNVENIFKLEENE